MEQVDMKSRWLATSPKAKAELAKSLGTSVNTLSQIANGFSGIGRHFLRLWANEWGIEPEQMIMPERRQTETPGRPGRKPLHKKHSHVVRSQQA